MKGWLQKILTPPAKRSGQAARSGQVPAQKRSGALPVRSGQAGAGKPAAELPNATVVYGIGASFMFIAAFFLLMGGRWFPALVVFALGACFVGFALHFLKHQD